MSKKCLSVFDVSGIQDFIFSSPKAKENIGASHFVHRLLDRELVEIMEEAGGAVRDWEDGTFDPESGLSSILYIGGGNAMVLFDDRKQALEVTKLLSRRVMEKTQATLSIVTAHLETDAADFQKDRKEIFKRLQRNKRTMTPSHPQRGIAITREAPDGLPASKESDEKGQYLSCVAKIKRELTKDEDVFGLLAPKGWSFPKEFDQMGQKEGENHIAVVHIDGNSMGRLIDRLLSETIDYTEAVEKIRTISKTIDNIYKQTFGEMVERLIVTLEEDEEFKKRFSIRGKTLPLRPIILNGDDVTFVCNGRLAIGLSECFLRFLEDRPLEIDGECIKLSACAGIAIVKSHFPFYRAYDLAESLCGSAKRKAKHYNRENPGNWMDYHIVYGGFSSDIDEIRRRSYTLKTIEVLDTEGYPRYPLLLRPFAVETESKDVDRYRWHNFIDEIYTPLVAESSLWTRSRLKKLREAMISSVEEVKELQNINSSRGCMLPRYEHDHIVFDNDVIFHNGQTPYFEALELFDFYEPISCDGKTDGKVEQ